jgi:ATP-binding cassette subfamily F protein uup
LKKHFASDNETLKVIEAYEKALENPEDEEAYQKLLTEWINTMLGILKHNTSKLFKLKLEDFKLKVKTYLEDKSVCLLLLF